MDGEYLDHYSILVLETSICCDHMLNQTVESGSIYLGDENAKSATKTIDQHQHIRIPQMVLDELKFDFKASEDYEKNKESSTYAGSFSNALRKRFIKLKPAMRDGQLFYEAYRNGKNMMSRLLNNSKIIDADSYTVKKTVELYFVRIPIFYVPYLLRWKKSKRNCVYPPSEGDLIILATAAKLACDQQDMNIQIKLFSRDQDHRSFDYPIKKELNVLIIPGYTGGTPQKNSTDDPFAGISIRSDTETYYKNGHTCIRKKKHDVKELSKDKNRDFGYSMGNGA